MDEVDRIMGNFFMEMAGIFGVITWLSGWPSQQTRDIVDLEMRIGRLRRLVEDLRDAIN